MIVKNKLINNIMHKFYSNLVKIINIKFNKKIILMMSNFKNQLQINNKKKKKNN